MTIIQRFRYKKFPIIADLPLFVTPQSATNMFEPPEMKSEKQFEIDSGSTGSDGVIW